jgi:hypothetical protein
MSLGRNLKFVGHEIYHVSGPEFRGLPQIDNVIYRTEIEELKWIEETTSKIGEWRDIFRSTYIRWALAINGLHIASSKYKDPKWRRNNKFIVRGYRIKDEVSYEAQLAKWDGDVASEAHLKSANMIASYGIIDLYACFEELIFDFYRLYLMRNPSSLLVGPENKELKKKFRDKESEPEEWNSALKERLDKWHRNKLYDGLHKVLLSYLNTAGLEKPSSYKHSTPETWAETLRGIAILRNSLTHGEKYVSQELAEISHKPHGLNFKFNTGDEINLSVHHLMSVELFGDQLLTAMNLSMVEKAEIETESYNSKKK